MTAGFVGLVLLSAYILRVQRALTATTVYLNFKGHVSVYHQNGVDNFFAKPARYQLTESELAAIDSALQDQKDKIQFTGKFISGAGLLSLGDRSVPVYLTGVDPEAYRLAHSHPTLLKWAKDWLSDPTSKHDDFLQHPQLISITESLQQILNRKNIDMTLPEKEREVQLAARTYSNDLNAVNAELGLIHSPGISMKEDTSVIAPSSLLQGLFDTQGAHYYAVFLNENVSIHSFRNLLQERLKATGLPLEVFSYDEEAVSPF